MTRSIFKYVLDPADMQEIQMPVDSQILSVSVQFDQICIWALVQPNEIKTARRIYVCPTGSEADGLQRMKFLGTVLMHGGNLVFHIFTDNQ